MKTASTNTPASKRLSLHSLPPRQSLPTWLLVDHAFSSFYLKSSSICWVCPTSPSLKVGDVDVSVSTPSHRLAPAARSEAHTTRDTGWLWRILALFFILLFIINVYSASLELHFFFRPLHYVVHCLRAFETVSGWFQKSEDTLLS